MISGPVILGGDPKLLRQVRAIFHEAREAGEFDPLRTEPTGAEWIVCHAINGVVQGFALLSYAGPGVLAIEPIWVALPWRRQGIAKGLLRHAMEAAPSIGGGQLLIGISDDNETTKNLACALGFEPRGVILARTVGD
jgi:GNAT superfamily N-acetyltransferase